MVSEKWYVRDSTRHTMVLLIFTVVSCWVMWRFGYMMDVFYANIVFLLGQSLCVIALGWMIGKARKEEIAYE